MSQPSTTACLEVAMLPCTSRHAFLTGTSTTTRRLPARHYLALIQEQSTMAALQARRGYAQDFSYGGATGISPYPPASYPPAASQQAPGYPYSDPQTGYPVPLTHAQPCPAAYPAAQPLPLAGECGSYYPASSYSYKAGLTPAYPANAAYIYGAWSRQPPGLPITPSMCSCRRLVGPFDKSCG